MVVATAVDIKENGKDTIVVKLKNGKTIKYPSSGDKPYQGKY